ncbi:choice-of-anchor Q domain-containing protein, partial [Candidatus Latescibacterota bacterium]
TITRNKARIGSGISVASIFSSPYIINSIISNNTGEYGFHVEDGNPSISYSNFWNNEGGNFNNIGEFIGKNVTTNANGDSCDAYNNIQLDPQFVDPDNSDYHLLDYSPCIGAGIDENSPENDIEGNPRGTPPDIGAYENSLNSPAQPPFVTLTYPQGGETWTYGEKKIIRWDSNIDDNVTIEYSVDNGDTWGEIAHTVPASDYKYDWEVPNIDSEECLLNIHAMSETSTNDTCDTFIMQEFATNTLIFHEGCETIEYNWYSYIPSTISKSKQCYILISGANGKFRGDYEKSTEEGIKLAEREIYRTKNYEYVLLTPVIPRNIEPDRLIQTYYSVAFDRNTFYETTNSFDRRADEKVNKMIDNLIYVLQKEGYNVYEKVFIEGFSAGGMFAQRYPLLQPNRVQAIAGGQCGGSIVMPENTYKGYEMNWPIGVNDYTSLVGSVRPKLLLRKSISS